MKHVVIRSTGLLMLALTLLVGSVQAASASAAGDQPTAGKARKKAASKAKHGGQIRFLPGSEETTRERSARLQRECKGRVNAGACAGYTN